MLETVRRNLAKDVGKSSSTVTVTDHSLLNSAASKVSWTFGSQVDGYCRCLNTVCLICSLCLSCTLHPTREVVLLPSPVGMHSQRRRCPPNCLNLTPECGTSLDPTHPSLLLYWGCTAAARPPTPAPVLFACFSVSGSCSLQSTPLCPLSHGLCSSNNYIHRCFTFPQLVCIVQYMC